MTNRLFSLSDKMYGNFVNKMYHFNKKTLFYCW